ECVVIRSDNEAVVVNIPGIAAVEAPDEVYWVDPIHPRP
ncbi:MAG TPA: mannose-6-phosphate isomerase, partial [Beijerinckiaceae bacterium]|nr:mannose-6-phosphate isomerase [Beijerinckiaceae bacterium]